MTVRDETEQRYGGSARQSDGEREVAEYLRRHPEFFERHQDLLTELHLPHPDSGKAVSLMERQVSILREQKQAMKQKLQHIARTARGNEALLERIQHLLVALVGAPRLSAVFVALREILHEEFHAEAVSLKLFRPVAELPVADYVSPGSEAHQAVQGVLDRREPVCGYLTPDQVEFLFPDRSREVVSGALIPLCTPDAECLGILGVGSVDPKRFHPEMGTVFLAHLGAVVAAVLEVHLRRRER